MPAKSVYVSIRLHSLPPTKSAVSAREAVAQAFEKLGGVEGLTNWAGADGKNLRGLRSSFSAINARRERNAR